MASISWSDAAAIIADDYNEDYLIKDKRRFICPQCNSIVSEESHPVLNLLFPNFVECPLCKTAL